MRTSFRGIAAWVCLCLGLVACGPLWGTYDWPTATPWQLDSSPVSAPLSSPTAPPSTPSPTPDPTPTARPPILYYTQSGDSLKSVAARFGVNVDEILSPLPLPPATRLLDPETPLLIPDRLTLTTPDIRLIPDSEVVYSPSAIDFDIEAYVQAAGGKLRDEKYYVNNVGWLSGAQVIQKIAIESSTNPRLLLALLQHESGWVYGQPSTIVQEDYPFGHINYLYRGLYQQLIWVVQQLSLGYYGWREGTLTSLTFRDGVTLRLAPTLNAGSVALHYYFAQRYTYAEWLRAMDVNVGFPALYRTMFGDPWVRAQSVEPVFPRGVEQPPLILPFRRGEAWAFTNGPHAAWYGRSKEAEVPQPRAALDFAPTATEPGCVESSKALLAAAPGLVVRTGPGLVVLDLDGDGHEQTGWVLVYLHVSARGKPPVGAWVNTGDVIGYPSCEGGFATGTHVHLVRKYNGEWVLAAGPLPFTLSGWVLQQETPATKARLVKGNQVVTENRYGMKESEITRQSDE